MGYTSIHCYKSMVNALKVLEQQILMMPPNGATIHEKANVLGMITLTIACFGKRDLCEDCAKHIDDCFVRAVNFLSGKKRAA